MRAKGELDTAGIAETPGINVGGDHGAIMRVLDYLHVPGHLHEDPGGLARGGLVLVAGGVCPSLAVGVRQRTDAYPSGRVCEGRVGGGYVLKHYGAVREIGVDTSPADIALILHGGASARWIVYLCKRTAEGVLEGRFLDTVQHLVVKVRGVALLVYRRHDGNEGVGALYGHYCIGGGDLHGALLGEVALQVLGSGSVPEAPVVGLPSVVFREGPTVQVVVERIRSEPFSSYASKEGLGHAGRCLELAEDYLFDSLHVLVTYSHLPEELLRVACYVEMRIVERGC